MLVCEAPPKGCKGEAERTAMMTPDETGLPKKLGNRLLALSGWTIDEFCAIFPDRRTLWLSPWPLGMREGRVRAARLAEEAADIGIGIVVVGSIAAFAFGLEHDDWFQWRGRFAAIPNPAPTTLGRVWRIPGMREASDAFFRDILDRHEAKASERK